MRRRKGSKYTWMPVLGTLYNASGEGSYQASDIRVGPLAPLNDNGTPPTETASPDFASIMTVPLVPDYTVGPDSTTQHTLRDETEGQDWFCRRIVGKIQLACNGNPNNDPATVWPAVEVCVALFVMRTRDTDTTVPDATDLTDIDPLSALNMRQPWIWRRTWILAATDSPGQTNGFNFTFIWPSATVEYGSMAEGSHIDAKTMRRILREQRLWMVISVRGYHPTNTVMTPGEGSSQPIVHGLIDLRVLGQMRRSRNRSAF